MSAVVTGPGVARAIASTTEGLRAGLTTALTRLFEARAEIRQLQAEKAEQAEAIRELQAMLARAYVDTERPSP